MNELRIYKSIDTLPLWNFAKVMESNDIRYLFVLKHYDDLPEQNISKDIWDSIMIEYFEHIGGQKTKKYILELSNLIKLRKKYTLITNATYVLCYKKDVELINIVTKYIHTFNTLFEFKQDNDKEYYQSIVEADRNANSLKDLITMKSMEFESKYKSKGNTKFDLYKVLTAFLKFYKVQIDPKTTTVREFIALQQEMVNEINAQNAKRKTRN